MVCTNQMETSNGDAMKPRLDPKWIALICLVVQNSGLALTMRYTFLAGTASERYIASTAVLLAEVLKLVLSLGLFYYFDCSAQLRGFLESLKAEFVGNYMDWFKLTVPSLLYTLQNSLQYFSMSQLSAPVFQVMYQMKIVTTAVFSVLILSRRITGLQWISIVALSGGVALVQLSQTNLSSSSSSGSNSLIGLLSVICGCFTSGFAGVYFEMVLKQSKASIWLRNIQLAAIGIVFSAMSCYYRDYEAIATKGFFLGYNNFVYGVIILQAAGGLIVAVVVKYADNVLKGFATSLSILLSCVVSLYLFGDVNVNAGFAVGAMIVVGAAVAFGYNPQTPILHSPKSVST